MSSRRLAADVAVGFWPWPGFTVQSAGIFPVRMLKQHYGFRAAPCAAGQGLAVRELVELPFRELVRLGLHGALSEASLRRPPQLCDRESLWPVKKLGLGLKLGLGEREICVPLL